LNNSSIRRIQQKTSFSKSDTLQDRKSPSGRSSRGHFEPLQIHFEYLKSNVELSVKHTAVVPRPSDIGVVQTFRWTAFRFSGKYGYLMQRRLNIYRKERLIESAMEFSMPKLLRLEDPQSRIHEVVSGSIFFEAILVFALNMF
jgi:hypothetical protein